VNSLIHFYKRLIIHQNMETGSITDSQERKLKTFLWKPSSGAPKALVFLSHGYAEHLVPYYSELAQAGVDQGLLVFGHDHVGHGESEGERVLVSDMEEFVAPVIQHCQHMCDQYPDTPLFIVGHSMGGLITLLTSLSPQCPALRGMVLMGPLVKPDPRTASRFQIFLAKVASKIVPQFQIGGVDPDLVTSDQEKKEAFVNDDLNHHGGIKALLGYVLLGAMSELEENFSNVKTPYLLILGSEDKICNVEGSQEFHKASGSEDKTFKTIDGGYHHLFIEKQEIRDNSIDETWSWILNRL